MLGKEPFQFLFVGKTLLEKMNNIISGIRYEIDNIPDAEVIEKIGNGASYLEGAIARCALNIPMLLRKNITFDPRERPGIRFSEMEGKPRQQEKVHFYDIEVPFEGDASYFEARPEGGSPKPIQGGISESSSALLLNIAVPLTGDDEKDGFEAKKKFEQTLASIEEVLDRLRAEVPSLKDNIEECVRLAVRDRFDRYEKNRRRLKAIGYPLKKREDALILPVFQKSIVKRRSSSMTVSDHVTLDAAIYEEILEIIQRMALVMERNPSSFHDAGENVMRDHFLIQLNGAFEGEAVGEAFNQNGKTDILVRAGRKNVFIAECKIWEGVKKFPGAVDQLLGYMSWRDTKAALLVFNRGRDSSVVLESISAAMLSHSAVAEREPCERPASLRYRLKHPTDRNVRMTLTIMVFDVPRRPKRKKAPRVVKHV